MPPIQATTPIEIQAAVLDLWWLKYFSVTAPHPGGDALLSAQLLPYNAQGKSDPSKLVNLTLPKVFEYCATHPDAADALAKVLAVVKAIGVEQGKL